MNGITGLLDTPIGRVAIRSCDGVLTGVELEPDAAGATGGEVPGALASELRAYFADGAHGVNLPFKVGGTRFQNRVWSELRRIPAGQTTTYGELARRLGTSPRAVGGACRANPCPIVVPCHRVVAVHGLGGFAGDTSGRRLEVKRWLLAHEGVALP
jgi:methylated-DNA-[protein]-cysteine S-methyltransferase